MEYTEISIAILIVIIYFSIGHGFQKLFNDDDYLDKNDSFLLPLLWPIVVIIISILK